MSTGAASALQRLERPLSTRPLIYGGNRIQLIRGGAEYFPQLLAAIATARRTVCLETYIFELDGVGRAVCDALAAAAARGAVVRVLVDGFGSAAHLLALKQHLAPAGVELRVFRPGRWWSLQRRLLRRMHRKIALIDDRLAFVGGINIIDDHHHPGAGAADLGPRYDFAVAFEGPLVASVAFEVNRLWWTVSQLERRLREAPPPPIEPAAPMPENMRAALLLRDNLRNRRTIERAYIDAIEAARRDVLLANAYFLPGRRIRQALVAAARRGVRVRLLLQGRIEYRLQHYAQQALYGELVQAGVEIYEYTASFLHAKVAVVDDVWATVGSSNIDPYSLLLAREANIAVFEARFAGMLRQELELAVANAAEPVQALALRQRVWWRQIAYRTAYAVVRLLTVIATRRFED